VSESQEGYEQRPPAGPYGAEPYGAAPQGAGPTQPGTHPGTWPYATPQAWNPQAAPPYAGYPPFPPPAPPRRHGRVLAALAGVALVAATAGVTVGHAVWHTGTTASASASSGQSGSGSSGSSNPFGSTGGNGNANSGQSGSGGSSTNGSGGPSDVSAIAQKVDPALVDVNSTFSYQSAEGAGTGIVLTSNGEILTNNHVINGATSISVTDVGNGKTYAASVVGYDDAKDIAVLQLQNASGLTTANIGDSSKVSVGQSVVAIGNAGGVGGTPNSAGGSVTALNQAITASDELDGTNEQLSGLIAVNADVQSGDSGGSLVNASGQVIGMDTAASESYSLQSQSAGAGFAIPIDSALSIARQIESGESSTTVHVGATAFLGVLVDSSSGQSGNGGLGTVSGAEISQVVPGGAAQQAGLSAGDVVTSLDGHSVTSAADLTTLMGTLKPGQPVSIGYTDAYGQAQTATVTPASGPPA
jgi:S1-C subfamily serine protease